MPLPTREVEIEASRNRNALIAELSKRAFPRTEVTKTSERNHVLGIHLFERLPWVSTEERVIPWSFGSARLFDMARENRNAEGNGEWEGDG